MRQLGLKTWVEDLGNDRANVVGVLPGEKKGPGLLYCGHLDTVAPGSMGWHHDPLGAQVIDNRMYGRGTVDLKSGLAAMVMAAGAVSRERIRLQGDLIVLGTADEEVDQIGAKAFRDRGGLTNVASIVIGEPTNLKLVTAHRGALWLKLSTAGRSAHGAMPEQGINAINHMSALVAKLSEHQFAYEQHPLLAKPSMNVGTIHGGTKINMVPDLCTIMVDIRTLPGQQTQRVLRGIQSILDCLAREREEFRASIEVVSQRSAVETSPDREIVCAAMRVGKMFVKRQLKPTGVTYYTDASLLSAPQGIPTIVFGPGDEKLAHQPDENVKLEQVYTAIQFYGGLALEMLKPR
jgi:succinyl-diaminopimelate desuccinylase